MDDLFADFQRVARALTRELQLRPGALEEGLAIVRCALQDEWIGQVIRSRRRLGARLGVEDHRIAEWFQGTGRSQVVEVLELAAYLKALAHVPKLESVIAQMKVNYDHSFLQLAIAYRLLKLGYGLPEFEPLTSGGRSGDILCSTGGKRIVI